MKKNIEKILDKFDIVRNYELVELISSFDCAIKSLKHKLWENNMNSNILLYEMNILNQPKKSKFNPKVSIIIPVYNGSNYLKYAIESALAQTYHNIEILVINDGSNDDGKSKKIAEAYGKKIRYFEKENGGVSSALNYGIQNMSGDYFAWLSHDDLIDPIHIEKLVEYVSIEGNEKVIPYSAFKIIDEHGVIKLEDTIDVQLHCFDYKTSILKNEFSLLKGEINGGSVLIPKDAFDKYGLFNEQERITQERDMWSRLITEYQFINIPYDTASIRVHSQQVSNTNPNIKIESDKKNIEIIKNVSEDRIKKMGLNKLDFYEILKMHYKDNGNNTIAQQLQNLIDDIIQKK